MPLERVVDRGAHLVARRLVALVVLDPEPRAVGDRRVVEADEQHVGGRRLQHARAVRERFRNDGLHVIRLRGVARAHLHLDPGRRRRLRVVRDRFLRDDVVRQDDEVAGLGAELRRAPGDLGDAPLELADLDPVADVERLLALEREAGERVAERVLEREADDDGADRGGRDEPVGNERRGEHDQADDHEVLDDRREPVRHAVRAQRVDQADDDEVDEPGGEREPLELAQILLGDVQRSALT